MWTMWFKKAKILYLMQLVVMHIWTTKM